MGKKQTQRDSNRPSKPSVSPLQDKAAPLPSPSAAESFERVRQAPSQTAQSQDVRKLQRTIGNRMVQHMLTGGGQPFPGAHVQKEDGPEAEAETEAPGTENAAAEEMQRFQDAGPYPAAARGQTIVPGASMGGFNARYDAKAMELKIMVNIEMTFLDGLTVSGNRVTANDTSLAGVASQINAALARLSGAELQAALTRVRSDWQWTGPTDPRIVSFMSSYRQTVQNAWSSAGTGLVFQSSRDGWESQLARVIVDVDTVNATPPLAAANGRQPTHCQANIYKTKEGRTDYGAAVGPGTAASATDQTLWLGSSDVATEQHLLTTSVFFGNNTAELSNDTKARLRRWIISFQAPAGGSGTTLDIIGRANTVGGGSAAGDEYNRQLSMRRAQAVANFIRTERVEGRTLENVTTRLQSTTGSGAAGATDAAYWRRVDIVAAGGQGQNIAAHEFGHMIGLHDEYASTPQRDAAGRVVTDAQGDPVTRGLISGTGGDVGEATGHNQLGEDMGVGGSVYENNDNIMSLGNTIRPQHYATFMEALRTVTSITEWRMQQ